jgi:hypothetical protein
MTSDVRRLPLRSPCVCQVTGDWGDHARVMLQACEKVPATMSITGFLTVGAQQAFKSRSGPRSRRYSELAADRAAVTEECLALRAVDGDDRRQSCRKFFIFNSFKRYRFVSNDQCNSRPLSAGCSSHAASPHRGQIEARMMRRYPAIPSLGLPCLSIAAVLCCGDISSGFRAR